MAADNRHRERKVGDQAFAEIQFTRYLSRKPSQSILSVVWTSEDPTNCPLIAGSEQTLTTELTNDTVRARFNNLAAGQYTVWALVTLQNPTEKIGDYVILDVKAYPT
jgi:hypothetical protein